MTDDEAYMKLINRRCSRKGALRTLTYAFQAQQASSWRALVVNDGFASGFGGSEAAKELTLALLKDAGIDPMAVTFAEALTGQSPFSTN